MGISVYIRDNMEREIPELQCGNNGYAHAIKDVLREEGHIINIDDINKRTVIISFIALYDLRFRICKYYSDYYKDVIRDEIIDDYSWCLDLFEKANLKLKDEDVITIYFC